MNAKSASIALLALTAAWLRADEVLDPSKLPEPVRQALRSAGETAPVKEITVRHLDGRLVYDVVLEQRNAPNPRMRIAADGSVLRDARVGGDTSEPRDRDESKSKLEELPRPVQDTVKREAAGREIGDIDREFWNGEAGYKVTVRESGRNPAIYVKDDGGLHQPTEKPPGAKTLFRGTRFEDAPRAVQQTIRRDASDGEIVKIEKQNMIGENALYRVTLKNREGQFELEIYENGNVLRDSRRSGNR